MDHRNALIVLNMLPGIGPGKKRLLESLFGSVEAGLCAPLPELCRAPGIGERTGRLLSQWFNYCNPEEEQELASRCRVALITEEDEDYPPLLREIHDPPICLYVRGNLKALRETENSIAIVGSRNCTAYGMRMAGRLAREASAVGWPVVSGLARGIDTIAHETTLQSGGCTIAVIGCGLSSIYPRENLPLAMRIAECGGAVISEFSMRYQADRRSFPMRNRIISGIASGTIVVEAGLRSGSLITAAQALDQNRTVFAVPGPADSYASQGCHALIRDGAVLVESFQDVTDELSGLPGLSPRGTMPPVPPPRLERRKQELQGLELKLWNLMQQGETDIDNLIDASAEEPACVSAALLTLELKRLIQQLPGRKVKITAP